MTYNQLITLFRGIAAKHHQIKRFGNGEEWEINEQPIEGSDQTITTTTLKPGILYPIWFAIPIDSTDKENTTDWRFEFLVFGIVKKDRSNEAEMLSDCKSIMTDLFKIFTNESDDYTLLNEPIMTPFKEKYGDYCAGWRAEYVIETQLSNNYCDIPADELDTPVQIQANWVIRDINTGDVIYELNRLTPGSYYIESLTEIRQSLDNPGPTIIQVLS